MPARFSFEVDRPRNLVRIVMTGLFEPEHVAAFFKERRKAHAMLGCAPHRHVTLADLRAMRILPQQTVAAFGELLADPESRARRLAFVVAPTLVRGQLGRALAGRDSRCFEEIEAAEAWLLEDEPEVAQAEARVGAEAEAGAGPARRWFDASRQDGALAVRTEPRRQGGVMLRPARLGSL